MASALIEELTTVATEIKRRQIKDAMGSSWEALAVEDYPQGRRMGTLLIKAGAGRGKGRGERVGRGGGGVKQQEKCEDPLATQPNREIELS